MTPNVCGMCDVGGDTIFPTQSGGPPNDMGERGNGGVIGSESHILLLSGVSVWNLLCIVNGHFFQLILIFQFLEELERRGRKYTFSLKMTKFSRKYGIMK